MKEELPGLTASATGSPLHLSGVEHVTGRSRFVGDDPLPANGLHLAVVPSPIAHGVLKGIDATAARALPGVAAVFTAADIPGENQVGGILPDETLLAEGHVHYAGEPVALVAADDPATARRAAALVRVDVEALPPIFTIEEAVAAGSYVGPIRRIERGDPDGAFANAPHVLSGTACNDGQEHFYLETQRARAVPEEDGALTVFSSTQNPTEVQRMCAAVLGKPRSRIAVEVRRLGGGFGGKEAQATPWACLAALAASLTDRPAELVLDREEDMRWTGKRHAYRSPWRIAFDDAGRLLAWEVELRSNAGAVADVSTSVLERSMLHADNAYHVPNVRVVGRPCRTNLAPATAFRGFGAPQGVFAIEHAMDRVARHLGLDPLEVRRRNLYRDGDRTHFGQVVQGCILEEVVDRVRVLSGWDERRAAVAAYNRTHEFSRKGLAVTPIKFGISFTAAFLNQGVALVHVYGDGSVSVSHGAIEMGQEVNTKIGQIVAAELGIPLSRVRVEGHSTRRTANASPTAASSGCDLNGHAAEDAARQIATRLKGLAARLLADAARGLPACADTIRLGDDGAWDLRDPDRRIPFPELVAKAVLNRVDLGAHGFYATPGVEFNRDEGRGNPFLYFVFGAAVSEVTVDLLTGRTRVDGAWIVHDSGRSLNVAVDLGQIHGAYVQCLGWVTTEELVYDAGGRLLSDSPTTYKIPSYGDAPALLQVELADNPRNEPGLKRSKANGEPPFLYGESVFFAIEDALASLGAAPDLAIPATPERVLQAADQARRVAASVPQTAAAPTRGARCIPTTPSTGTR